MMPEPGFRIARDLVAHRLAALRHVPLAALDVAAWTGATKLPDPSLTAEVAAWTGRPFAGETLGAAADCVRDMLVDPDAVVTLMTSGSTGEPKPCPHLLADLRAEAAAWVDLLGPVQRVVSVVPAQHIYGLIWGVLLPPLLGATVVEARFRGPGFDLPAPRPGDLMIGVPALWPHVLRTLASVPKGVAGTSSTAPMPPDLARDIDAAGIAPLWQIYGSSEAAGVGWRTGPDDPFTLLGVWDVVARDPATVLRRRGGGGPVELPDRIEWLDATRFRVAGRRDGAVQVAGQNVFPNRVAEVLRQVAGVADCAVRLGAEGRLKAFVVPAPGSDEAALREALRDHARQTLSDAERPRGFTFGPTLPRSAIGKLSDWE